MVFLRITSGTFALIGALGLGATFRDNFTELSTLKKAAIILSHIGAIGSTALGFTSVTKNPFASAATVVPVVAFSVVLFKKSSKETNK